MVNAKRALSPELAEHRGKRCRIASFFEEFDRPDIPGPDAMDQDSDFECPSLEGSDEEAPCYVAPSTGASLSIYPLTPGTITIPKSPPHQQVVRQLTMPLYNGRSMSESDSTPTTPPEEMDMEMDLHMDDAPQKPTSEAVAIAPQNDRYVGNEALSNSYGHWCAQSGQF